MRNPIFTGVIILILIAVVSYFYNKNKVTPLQQAQKELNDCLIKNDGLETLMAACVSEYAKVANLENKISI